LLAERRAMTTLEVALVGPIFILSIVALFELTYLFLAQMLLDYAVHTVARSIQTGQAQQQTSQANFNTNVLCQALVVLPCSNLMLNIQAVTDWYTPQSFTLPMNGSQVNSSGFAYCNGTPGQLIQINAVFMAPIFFSSLPSLVSHGSSGTFLSGIVTYNGTATVPLYAAAAFADEQFPLTAAESNPC
jgi:Flp pilus assembly protein TadG